MQTFTMSREEMESNANLVVQAIANQLSRDGIIKSADVVTNRYVVVLHKKGKLSAFLDRFFNRDTTSDSIVYRVLQTGYDETYVDPVDDNDEPA